ncbi:MAG: ATP synthase subunit I [Bryobacterales bacterium]|nr:ATP synthase subunit I [Bryobacterales bacterium]
MFGDSFHLDAAVHRLKRIMAILAAAGTILFAFAKGTEWGVGFLLGALISIASFHWTHRFVMAIGPGGEAKPRTWKSVLLGARYLIIAAVVYAIISSFGLNILAALCGLLIAAVAALLEILYEFIHGT